MYHKKNCYNKLECKYQKQIVIMVITNYNVFIIKQIVIINYNVCIRNK